VVEFSLLKRLSTPVFGCSRDAGLPALDSSCIELVVILELIRHGQMFVLSVIVGFCI